MQERTPCAVAFKVGRSLVPELDLPCQYKFGEDCVDWFLEQLQGIYDKAAPFLNKISPMIPLTNEEKGKV